MMRTISGTLVALALLLAGCCEKLSSQSQSPQSRTGAGAGAAGKSTSGPYRIAGTVVNAVTGEPIRRASVAVLSEPVGTEIESHAVESAVTDNEGRFSLPGLAAAKYQLTASKRGFRTAWFDEHDEYSTAIVTGEGQDTSSLTFKLMPGAVLHGVVTGDGGDAVENARVILFLRPRGNKPGQHIEQVETANTDDSGAYEFSNLAAGDYLVAVTAEPWYAQHSSFAGSNAKPASDQVSNSAAALDVAYPITFFDSTTDEGAATAVSLAAGSVEQANIALHAVAAVHLRVLAPIEPNKPSARPELRHSIFGNPVPAENSELVTDEHTGIAEFSAVAPGRYELSQGDPPRIVELDATASQQVDPGAGVPTTEVRGTVKDASAGALATDIKTDAKADIKVSLEPADGEPRQDPMQADAARGTFRFPSVAQGKWQFTASAGTNRLAVIGVATGNRARTGNELTVADRPIDVTLTVSRAEMRVDGFARKDGKGFAGAMVVLVPKDLDLMGEEVRRDQSDSDGSFSLRGTAPGQYTVVAIQNGWDLDWSRAEVIRRYLPRGTPVTVTETPAKTMSVSGPVEVQSP
jgi:hypothetical protein